MLYRRMPNVEPALSILGAGCMRLPMREDGGIDEPHATRMLRYAIDQGVNYVDTAWPYHGGESEPLVGRALRDGYRERVQVATKLPTWLVHSRADMDRFLALQLERLQTDHIDFYLVHALNGESWRGIAGMGIQSFLDDALADGRIRYAGFSFHGDLPSFREIVDARRWSFCQVQYNFMDRQYQAGAEGIRYAAARGLGVIVMEPLRGGVLAREIPSVRTIYDRAPIHRSPADWAHRWIWNDPDVHLLLSGFSAIEQAVENIACAAQGHPGSLTALELALVDEVRGEYERRMRVPCTACGYCMPCPSGVNIPECLESFNIAHMYDSVDLARGRYEFLCKGSPGTPEYASACTECGACQTACPQAILVSARLQEVAELFGK
jgi:predicted aldo/keto reductase-like oxidoreductase